MTRPNLAAMEFGVRRLRVEAYVSRTYSVWVYSITCDPFLMGWHLEWRNFLREWWIE